MELVSCQPPDDFLLPGVLRTNFCRGQALFCHDINQDIARVLSFNALMGLSCYIMGGVGKIVEGLFQCPYGLELLRQECPIF